MRERRKNGMHDGKKFEIDFTTDPRFNILNVARKVGVTIIKPDSNSGKYIGLCPFCDDKSGHLYLTIQNGKYHNVYKCVKCGESGSAVKLYSKVTGIDYKQTVKELANSSNDKEIRKYKLITKQVISKKNQNKINDVLQDDKLDVIYKEFLSLLTLNEEHTKKMLDRGMFYRNIVKNGYKSIPQAYKERHQICRKLQSKFGEHCLNGVSGFFYQKKYNTWDFLNAKGMLIPCKNAEGQILSLQIRLDGDVKRRYISFSSVKFYKGTPCNPHIHVAFNRARNWNDVVITEGPIKADIASQFLDHTVLALPGVGALHFSLIEMLKKNHVKSVKIAFDMNILDNPQVQKAYTVLTTRFKEERIDYTQLIWEKYYKENNKLKGIDDFLLFKHNKVIEKVFG